jgi:2-haloacid dehalogenase
VATPLHEIRACVFDAYGTLFDVASAAHRCRDALDGQAAALAARWRDKQLQYTWLRTIQGRHVDFLQVTRDALAYAMEELGIAGPALQEQLVEAYCTLDAYAEVPDVLRRIRAAGYATAILSNGSPAMLGRMVAHAGIADLFDAVLSVEAVGVFKPDAKVYQSAVDHFGLRAAQICFLSSNAWDAYAASAFGMRVVWCNRYGLRDERLPGAPDARIRTLEELAPLLGRAVRG